MREFQPKIVTANHLLEGSVVYFTDAGLWQEDIAGAAIATSADAAQGLLDRAKTLSDLVVEIYLADVTLASDGAPVPAHFRETFRLNGPSNRPEHGRSQSKDLADVSL